MRKSRTKEIKDIMFTVRLTPDLLEQLKRQAAEYGVSEKRMCISFWHI